MSPSTPKARYLKSYADPAALPHDGLPQIVFLGRSNAGKSSLINSLTGVKDLANVSATPGRTRLINLFDVGGRYHLVDLPGYGFVSARKGEREKLAELIHGYLSASDLLRFAVIILDGRLGPTTHDSDMIASLSMSGIPFLIILNKADKLSRTELMQMEESMHAEYPNIKIIPHSSVTGLGHGALAEAIEKALSTANV